ncbi:MAG: hypothetical protein K9K82_14210 [Desulfobacteraceae bacterium]|nr:hypothetical protein [Desulfobacteraceae bacterium]
MIDFQHLGKTLSTAGLVDKPVNQYSKQEVETLVQACIDALKPGPKTEYVTAPYIDSNGDLRIPFNSDPKYHWWKGYGQSLLETLRELGASEETVRKYVKIEEAPPF